MVMRWLLGFALFVTVWVLGFAGTEEVGIRASGPDASARGLSYDRETRGRKTIEGVAESATAPNDEPEVLVDVEEQRVPNVWIFGSDGNPVVGCWFQVSVGEAKTTRHTDANGGLELPIPCTLKCGAYEWPVETDGLELRVQELVPLDIEILAPRGDRVPVPARAAARNYVRGGSGHAPIPSHVVWGKTTLRFDVDLPEGLARLGTEVSEAFVLSRYARRARLAVPTWRTTTLFVLVRNEAGTPALGAVVSGLTIAKKGFAAQHVVADRDGRIAVRGVPLLRHERLFVEVKKDLMMGSASIPLNRESETEITMNEIDYSVSMGGGVGGEMSGRSGRRRRRSWFPKRPPANLILEVRRANGTPASSAMVRFAKVSRRTDRSGRVRFEAVIPGSHSLIVSEPGLVTLRRKITLAEGKTSHLTLRESNGKARTVYVEDHEGAVVPFARITVHGGSTYARVVDGVQDLVLWTDHNGEIELPRLSAGNDRVWAAFGSRRKQVAVGADRRIVVDLAEPR